MLALSCVRGCLVSFWTVLRLQNLRSVCGITVAQVGGFALPENSRILKFFHHGARENVLTCFTL